jgi:hypothetical protein
LNSEASFLHLWSCPSRGNSWNVLWLVQLCRLIGVSFSWQPIADVTFNLPDYRFFYTKAFVGRIHFRFSRIPVLPIIIIPVWI